MGLVEKVLGKNGPPSFIVGVLFNGAVAAALVTGILTIYGSWYENKQRLESEVVLKLLAHDSADNKNVVSAFRTLAEIGVLDKSVQKRWEDYAKANPDTLPRFYHSGFIWSIFHPQVPKIKRALAELGFYDGKNFDGDVDAAFVLATMRAQRAFCERYLPKDGETDVAKCRRYADGLLGKGTLHEISIMMDDAKKRLVLD